MLTKRIIPCLDIDKGRVVKGVQFSNLVDAGNPIEIAERYNEEGADELVFLDITASNEDRRTIYSLATEVSKKIFIPFTIGGGIRCRQDVKDALNAGADKVAVNTAAVQNPSIIAELGSYFGSQCIVLAVDVIKKSIGYEVAVNGGRTNTGIDAFAWCKVNTGPGKAGEILLTSMDKDGSKEGFDLELLYIISALCSVPVIASGGAGSLQHLYEAIHLGKADGVLAASIFHYGHFSIKEVKQYLHDKGIAVRIE